MKKKSIYIFGLVLLTSIVSFGLGFVFDKSNKATAQKKIFEKWEYGSINSIFYFEPEKQRIDKIFGIVEFCKMTQAGCQRSEIRYELDYGKFLKQANLQETFDSRKLASLKASELAFQKALSQLGNSGWEITSEPEKDFKSVSLYDYERLDNKNLLYTKTNTKAIYFKRLKNR